MLPFLKSRNNNAGVIVKVRRPDEKPEEAKNPDENQDLEACCEDLMQAVQQKDIKAMVIVIRELHDLLHEEMSGSKESNDYHDQNEKAVEGLER